MLINDIEFELKDGRRAVLRNPREEDIEGTLEYLRTAAGETDFLLRRCSFVLDIRFQL